MNDDLHPLDESIRTSLHDAADDLTVELMPAGALARRGRMRRLRRRTLGVCAVGALIVGGVVVVTRGDDGAIQTADDPSPTSAVQLTADEQGDGDALVVTPPPTLPTVDAPATDAAAEPAFSEVAGDEAALSSFSYGPDGLYPWGDGFLSIRTEYHPQPLPELSDEITALFPQEVLDVFPDGLPGTIDEAMNALTEAGLLDEVSAILSEHPEAMDAVYSAEPVPPTQIVEYSVDGVTWEPVPGIWPSPHHGMTVNDGRIVVWSMDEQPYGEYGPLPDPDGVRTLTVHVTSDLQTWADTTVEIPIVDDPRDYVHGELWVQTVATTADGWVAVAQTNQWIDELSLLPDDVRRSLEEGGDDGYGYGFGLSEDGFNVERFDDATGEWSVETYTWADLGIDPIDYESIYSGGEASLIVHAGGVTDIRPMPADLQGVHQVQAVDGRLFASGDGTLFVSDDTVTWTSVTGIPERVWIATIVPVETGALILGEGPVGPMGWLLDRSNQLTEVDLPDLPNRYSPQSFSSSAAWIIELYDDSYDDWEPVTIVVEHEGFSVEMTDRPEGQTVIATDLASGEVVYELDQSWDDEAWQDLWEWDDEAEEGWIVLHDADGAELVRIPMEIVDRAYQELSPVIDDGPAEVEVWAPDFWLVATTNGSDWFVLDLEDPDPRGDGFWPSAAAINGNRVLYRTADGWQLATIG